MTESKDWLVTLDQATSYRELQSAVTQMFADASATNDAAKLAAAIDEAIQKIERERARDQAELDSDSAEYDAFKQQQSGVMGWLKRKMPFTETRRQDLQHREAIDEQKAEVLADNFVIARAQMLKERLLPPNTRRLGAKLDEWQSRFLSHESIDGIRKYGEDIQGLSQAIATASTFVKNIAIDVEAFAQASFSDRADRTRRDSDLQVGRSELKALLDEIQNKVTLRKTAIKRLSELVRDELISQDPTFRTIVKHTQQLAEVCKEIPTTLKLAEDRLAESKLLHAKLKELQTLPQSLEKQQREHQALRRQCDESESRFAAASRELVNPSQQYEAASRNLEQAKVALVATKPMYDAYVAEQQGAVGDSPVVTEHERLQSAVAQAERELQRLTPEFERLKRIFETAKSEAESFAKKIDDNFRITAKLNEDQAKLENEFKASRDRLQWAKMDFVAAEQTHSRHLQDLSWLPEKSQLRGLPDKAQTPFTTRTVGTGNRDASWELQELTTEVERLDKYVKALNADQLLLRSVLAKQESAKLSALKQRSTMLLDPSVADALMFE